MDCEQEYRDDCDRILQTARKEFLGNWVRHRKLKKQATRPSPGLVEAVEISSHRTPFCTVRWADNRVTQEKAIDLEVRDCGNPGKVF